MALRTSSLAAGAIVPVGGPAGLPGQSTYQAWLTLPGNAGKSLADFVAAQKGAPGVTQDISGKLDKQTVPGLSVGFDLTPALGTQWTLPDGTDAAPRAGTDPTPTIFLSRVDQSTPGASWQGRLLSLHYKRLDGGNGSVQAARFRCDDFSTMSGTASQTVALTGISNVFGTGQGWGLYSEAWSHNTAATATALELDAANNSGADYVYNETSPFSVPHTKGLIIGGKKGSVPATGRNTMAIAVNAGVNAEFWTLAYIAPKSILKYGFDFAASPPTGILFRNGASTDGLGTTQGGIGIDMGPPAKGYGTAADQGAIHLRTHRLLAGLKSSEGGTGLTYQQFNTTTNRWEMWVEGVSGPSFGQASGYATIYGGANGLLLRDSAGTNQIVTGTTGTLTQKIGFNGNAPLAKQAIAAALPTDGSATNAQLATAYNSLRTILIAFGLAQ